MSTSDVTEEGIRGQRPGREAVTGAAGVVVPQQRRERDAVPSERHADEDGFSSYYGRPILREIVWEAPVIGGYLFLGGLAGASSAIAAGAELTGRPGLARPLRCTALAAITGSTAALIYDLGRPERFLNMLRVFKPTSPMSVGSWILLGYGPLAGVSATTALTGWFPRTGRLATYGSGVLGALVATYTAPLLSDTAVPSWHGGYRYMPFVFASSAVAAAGGAGLVGAPLDQSGPARRAGVGAALAETALATAMEHRTGPAGETYRQGRAGAYMRAAKALSLAGAAGAVLGRRSRVVSALSGAALVAGSVCTRLGVFHAGHQSQLDPKYTVVPQRQRLDARKSGETPSTGEARGAGGTGGTGEADAEDGAAGKSG